MQRCKESRVHVADGRGGQPLPDPIGRKNMSQMSQMSQIQSLMGKFNRNIYPMNVSRPLTPDSSDSLNSLNQR
jgi:hypothetical protein